jgi:hypothetical protein
MDNPDEELPKEYMSSFIYALGLPYSKKRSKRESKGIIEFFHIRMNINRHYLYLNKFDKR